MTRVRALLLVRGLAELRRGTEQTLIARVELGRLEVEAARRRRDLVGEVAEAEGGRRRVRGFHLLGHAGPGSPGSLGGRAARRRAAIDGSALRAWLLGPRCLTRCTRVQRFAKEAAGRPSVLHAASLRSRGTAEELYQGRLARGGAASEGRPFSSLSKKCLRQVEQGKCLANIIKKARMFFMSSESGSAAYVCAHMCNVCQKIGPQSFTFGIETQFFFYISHYCMASRT